MQFTINFSTNAHGIWIIDHNCFMQVHRIISPDHVESDSFEKIVKNPKKDRILSKSRKENYPKIGNYPKERIENQVSKVVNVHWMVQRSPSYVLPFSPIKINLFLPVLACFEKVICIRTRRTSKLYIRIRMEK